MTKITIDRAALEQAEQEPDRWGAGYEAGYAAGMAEMKPEQAEPVAWMVYTQDGKSVLCVTDNPADFIESRSFPLYTHPPRREWQVLTDEEIENTSDQIERSDFFDTVVTFARAIEAALRSKNHD